MTTVAIDLKKKATRKMISSNLTFTKRSKLLNQQIFDMKISKMISHMETLMGQFDEVFNKEYKR